MKSLAKYKRRTLKKDIDKYLNFFIIKTTGGHCLMSSSFYLIREVNMFKKIKAIVVEQLGVIDPSEVTLESAFDSMDIDSIDAVDIIMAIEDEFEISIPDEEAESFNSIQDIINYLKKIHLGDE